MSLWSRFKWRDYVNNATKNDTTATTADVVLAPVSTIVEKDDGVQYQKNAKGAWIKSKSGASIKLVDRAHKLETSRTIALTGGVTGSVSFDGTQNVSISTTVQGIGSTTNLPTATVLNSITFEGGVAKGITTRTLTLADLGYTGATNATKYTHPVSSGYYHIPTGGNTGQVLVNNGNGIAIWGDAAGGGAGGYASLNGDLNVDFNAKILTVSNSIKAPKFYDKDNNNYYMDLSSLGTCINCAGDVIAAGDIQAYSDRRLKSNIQPITDALNKVLSLNGVTFTRTDLEDKEKRHVGIIAQDVEQVLPEAVETNEDGMKSVAYGNMVGLLIEAIKEQQSEIRALREEVRLLKG